MGIIPVNSVNYERVMNNVCLPFFQLVPVSLVIFRVPTRRNASKQAGCVMVIKTAATEVMKSHSTVMAAAGVSSSPRI